MKNSKLKDKIKANGMRFSAQTFVVGIILAITCFLFFIDSFKSYRSTITILVNAKSEITISQEQQIISNIIEFPHMLSFYDRMLKQNPDVTDITAGKSQDKRKEKWNSMLSIEQAKKNASVINISIRTNREVDAEKLVKKTVRTLFDTVGVYYDVKNDIDLRIIDGPISHSNVAGWYWIGLFSMVLGFLIAFLLQQILFKSLEIFSYRKDAFKKNSFLEEKNLFDFIKETPKSPEQEIKSLEDLYMSQQAEALFPIKKEDENVVFSEKDFTEEKPENTYRITEMKKLTKMIQQDKYPNFPEMPVRARQKAAAPDNLPVSDDIFPSYINTDVNQKELSKDEHTQKEKETPKTPLNHEPTEEELRKRLNQLLRGEL